MYTVKLKWLEYLWGTMKICSRQRKFELMSVNHSGRSGGTIGISFSIFLNMKVYCVFSLESPHRGDSNENTQLTIFNTKKNTLNYPRSADMGFFSKGLKNKFGTAVVNEPSVFKTPKVDCTSINTQLS